MTARNKKGRIIVGRRLPQNRPPTHPGETLLEEFLKPMGVSQSEFAVRLGVSYSRLNGVINGKRGVQTLRFDLVFPRYHRQSGKLHL